ncbi:alpha helical protein [Geobacter sp. DSM 9736]|uniref:zinc ribbon-containing protein n=1 Tax=Geobacter sp. DSM 9736 TaxID=1277350 RepID=UPI000B50E63E|nr:alpha helical protein [Geobacter sp. DSM 9736]SNB45327.1 Zinc-ribbon containing domain-containing protein [Geobacter sp. DSM 9736]
MTVKAGEEIHNSGDFRCQRCGELVHVEEGLTVPNCPGCGNTTFSWRDRPPKGH